MRSRSKSRLFSVLVVLVLLLVACGTDSGDSPGDGGSPGNGDGPDDAASEDGYFAGQNLEIIVAVTPGGSTDAMARVIAGFLSQHLDGRPTVQVTNIAGGASMLGPNQFALQRQPNGQTMLLVTSTSIMPWLLGDELAEYSFADMKALWLGNSGGHVVHVRPDSGIENAHDLANVPPEVIYYATISPIGTDLTPMLALEVLGALDNITVISGYEGGSAKQVAYQSGETNIERNNSLAYQENYPDEIPVFTLGMPLGSGPGGLDPDYLHPDVPTIAEAYLDIYGSLPEGEAWDVFKALQEGVYGISHSLWTHADAPPEALEALQAGFTRMIADEQYLELQANVLSELPARVGDEAAEWGDALANTDPAIVDWLKSFLTDRFDMVFD